MSGSFAKSVAKFSEATKDKLDRDVRGITLALFRGVILATPVDKGRARGGWQTSVGEPITADNNRLDPGGNQALADVVAKMGGAGTLSWLSNNVPYIGVLEHGGYPNPPKLGTWVPGKLGRKRKDGTRKRKAGHYEIRSQGGFSKQAPAGMVAINMARITQIAIQPQA